MHFGIEIDVAAFEETNHHASRHAALVTRQSVSPGGPGSYL
jgi:hypothetical protein